MRMPRISSSIRKFLEYRFCLLKKMCNREIGRHFAVDLIAHAYRDLIQIAEHIEYGEGNVCGSLHPASVFGSHAVEPAHTSRTSGGRTVFAAVSAAVSQFIRLVSEDLADKCAAPTALEYALLTVMICLISYGGMPAPIAP